MTPKNKYLYIARVTLQTETPLSIGSGVEDARFDSPVVRDANGLPALPATSIAGVLRHGFDKTEADALFGYANGDDGAPSRVTVSWGHIHDSNNRPLDGLDFAGCCQTDTILSRLKGELPLRDHVRLTHRGSAANEGKFDRSFVPRGCRFTFELSLWYENKDDDTEWQDLLQRIASSDFRLGGSTRRGYGGLKVNKLMTAGFNLESMKDYESYSKLSRRLDECDGFTNSPLLQQQSPWLYADITLQPEDFWRFGGGTHPTVKEGKQADMLPYTEQEIIWKDGKGAWNEKIKVPLPASAIKGALAHRVAFHANRHAGYFSNDKGFTLDWDKSDHPVVQELFGYAKNTKDGKSTGKTGVLWLDDVYLDLDSVKSARLMHNSVDRFTGGVRTGALFSEEALYGGEIKLRLCFTKQAGEVSQAARKALKDALDDLCKGRLALGSSGAKGLGYFSGEPKWNDKDEWLKGGE